MQAAELIERIEALGGRLRVDGGRLWIQTTPDLPRGLLDELRNRKSEVLPLLRTRSTVADSVPGKVHPTAWPATAEEILGLPLRQFAHAGLVLTVASEVLGETVLLASDNAVIDPGERRVVYRAAELAQLLCLRPQDLRSVHEVKRIFGGTVLAS